MAREIFRISAIASRDLDEPATRREINHLITEVNKGFAEVTKLVGEVNGRDGATPQFFNDLDLGGHNVTNVKAINFGVRPHAQDELTFTGHFDVDDPAAAPATATALRDDITDNVLPDIREALLKIGKMLVRILAVVRV